jgi:hypothetical protein
MAFNMTMPAPAWGSEPALAEITQRDDGLYQLGLSDEADGPFPNRAFAEAVAAKEARHVQPPDTKMREAALAGGCPEVAKSNSSTDVSNQSAVQINKIAAAAERVRP